MLPSRADLNHAKLLPPPRILLVWPAQLGPVDTRRYFNRIMSVAARSLFVLPLQGRKIACGGKMKSSRIHWSRNSPPGILQSLATNQSYRIQKKHHCMGSLHWHRHLATVATTPWNVARNPLLMLQIRPWKVLSRPRRLERADNQKSREMASQCLLQLGGMVQSRHQLSLYGRSDMHTLWALRSISACGGPEKLQSRVVPERVLLYLIA